MKKCCTCKVVKSLEEFHWKNKLNNVRQGQCIDCHRTYHKTYYERNRQKYIKKAAAWNKSNYIKLKKFVQEYFSSHFCVDCGENDIAVLDFDHVRGKKKFNISDKLHGGISLTTLIEEIEKCDVRCANCHRRKTYKMERRFIQW